jgi:hypothetical protein
MSKQIARRNPVRKGPVHAASQKGIERQLTRAADGLLELQPDLFRFTKTTRQSEWNIARHFANELERLFPDYDVTPM